MTNTPLPSEQEPDPGPRLLTTVDPASDMGKALNDALSRLRFANVAPEIRETAQRILDGTGNVRDLLALDEFQPALDEAQRRLHDDLEDMDADDRERFLRPGAGAGARE
jgi:hypothetical protein